MPVPEKQSRIPVGSQFSPDLISLSDFINMAVRHSGDKEALRQAVVQTPVRSREYQKPPTSRQRMLPLEAAVQYGLLTTETYEATELTRELAQLSDEKELYEAFARHILLNLSGLRVVEAIQEMSLDKREVTGDSLARYLTEQGFRVTEHNTAINSLRMWLAQAGLFPKGKGKHIWSPNLEVKAHLLGLHDETIAALASLTSEQIAFVKALCKLEPKDWIAAADVRDLTELDPLVRIGRASLPNEILKPLERAGLIEYETGGTKSGKTSRVRVTTQFQSTILGPFLENALLDLDPVLTSYYRTRPEDIYASLESADKGERGRALEAYTIYVMRLLGLRFLAWRRRAQETGYSEVDVLMAGLFGILPTTWQIQCKNTPTSPFRVEDIAKEVGLLPLTGATSILVVANAPLTHDAERFAQEIMLKSSVTIFLLGADDFKDIKKNPGNMARILRSKAEAINRLHLRPRLWSTVGWSEKTSSEK